MKIRKSVSGRGLVILGPPVALVLTVMASIYVLDRTNGTTVSSGHQRQYLLYVPKSYDRAKPTPLVISLHAAAGWPAQQRNLSRWNPLADEQGFLVVYPSGSDVPKIWHVGRGAGLMRDVRFIAALIDTLEAAYNIDPTRIYANGISNGGAMAFVLSSSPGGFGQRPPVPRPRCDRRACRTGQTPWLRHWKSRWHRSASGRCCRLPPACRSVLR